MRIVATGGAGYLGSVLVPMLMEAGHEVTVVDRFFFGPQTLPDPTIEPRLHLHRDDTRWVSGRLFEGQDAVVDMAALSNDPAGALDPWKTFEIDFLGRSRVARLARQAGVARYVVTSSCSLYGFQEEILTEEATPRPLTAYAEANVRIEKDTLPLANDAFVPTAVRFATLYGLSPRMRFDIAINGMVLGAHRTGKIPMMRDGAQWRPFLHVRDAARALLGVLTAPADRVRGEVFNVGSDDQNFQIRPLAEIVAGAMEARPALEWYGDPDHRSYRVSFAKVGRVLGYRPELRPPDAVHEIERALREGRLEADTRTKTVEWYQHLLTDPADGGAVAMHGSVL
jgi:nucleoside-diphosphate-sugar epimerase